MVENVSKARLNDISAYFFFNFNFLIILANGLNRAFCVQMFEIAS